MTEQLREMIDKALDGATASLEDIARSAGVTYNTLYQWKTGRRNPTPENLKRLADAVRGRSDELRELADEIQAAADELEG